jgi:tetratricopeptide (TPR) repeat protein
MGFRAHLGVGSLAFLVGCVPPIPDPERPPKELVSEHSAPFSGEKKVEIPSEAKALGHFAKGQAHLSKGELNPALREFAAAAQADSSNAYLRIRLAILYLRKGDLESALKEAEEATRLEPDKQEPHQLLAGLYTSMGQESRGIEEYQTVLRIDPENQEALLYLGALYLKRALLSRAGQSRGQTFPESGGELP